MFFSNVFIPTAKARFCQWRSFRAIDAAGACKNGADQG
jgi:hypothetical protein